MIDQSFVYYLVLQSPTQSSCFVCRTQTSPRSSVHTTNAGSRYDYIADLTARQHQPTTQRKPRLQFTFVRGTAISPPHTHTHRTLGVAVRPEANRVHPRGPAGNQFKQPKDQKFPSRKPGSYSYHSRHTGPGAGVKP